MYIEAYQGLQPAGTGAAAGIWLNVDDFHGSYTWNSKVSVSITSEIERLCQYYYGMTVEEFNNSPTSGPFSELFTHQQLGPRLVAKLVSDFESCNCHLKNYTEFRTLFHLASKNDGVVIVRRPTVIETITTTTTITRSITTTSY